MQSKLSLNPGAERCSSDGLCQEIVCTCFQAAHFGGFVILRGEHDDREFSNVRIVLGPDTFAGLRAVESRHLEIQQHDIGSIL